MDGDRFDELTKRVARERPSRRRLLRGLWGTMAGAMLSGLGVSRAGVAKGGNSAAALWCHGRFSGAAAGQCTSQAAQGTGPYYSCAGPGGTPCTGFDTCGGGGTAGVCGCTRATTCPTGQGCGTAPDGCGGTLSCGTCTGGQTCCNGSCVFICQAGNDVTVGVCACGENATCCPAGCRCDTDEATNLVQCVDVHLIRDGGVPCTADADCPIGASCDTSSGRCNPDDCSGDPNACPTGAACVAGGCFAYCST